MRDKKSQALELGFEMTRFRLLDNFVEKSKFDEFQKLFASFFLGEQYDCWSEIERNLIELVQRDSEGYLRKMRAFSRSVDVKYFLELHHLKTIAGLSGISHATSFSQPVLHIAGDPFIKNVEDRGVPIHQDWPSLRGSYNSLVIWTPITGTQQADGGLYLYNVNSDERSIFPALNTKHVSQIESNSDLLTDPIYIAPKIGQVLVFDQFLPHASKSPKGLRISISMRLEDATEKEWARRGFSFAQNIHIDRLDKNSDQLDRINDELRTLQMDI